MTHRFAISAEEFLQLALRVMSSEEARQVRRTNRYLALVLLGIMLGVFLAWLLKRKPMSETGPPKPTYPQNVDKGPASIVEHYCKHPGCRAHSDLKSDFDWNGIA